MKGRGYLLRFRVSRKGENQDEQDRANENNTTLINDSKFVRPFFQFRERKAPKHFLSIPFRSAMLMNHKKNKNLFGMSTTGRVLRVDDGFSF